jgi:hypothetical protein
MSKKNCCLEKSRHRLFLFAGSLILAACSTTPLPPDREIQAAEQAIRQAEQARVSDHASPELRVAREKLEESRSAVRAEKMVRAARLAEQARVEADLALATAAVAKAQVVNDEMKRGADSLKQEMQRDRGMPQ